MDGLGYQQGVSVKYSNAYNYRILPDPVHKLPVSSKDVLLPPIQARKPSGPLPNIPLPSLTDILPPPEQARNESAPDTAYGEPRSPIQAVMDDIKNQSTFQLPISQREDSNHGIFNMAPMPLDNISTKFLEKLRSHPTIFTVKDQIELCTILLLGIFSPPGYKKDGNRGIDFILQQTDAKFAKRYFYPDDKSHKPYTRLMATGQTELTRALSNWLFVHKSKSSKSDKFMSMLSKYQIVEFWDRFSKAPPEEAATREEFLRQELNTLLPEAKAADPPVKFDLRTSTRSETMFGVYMSLVLNRPFKRTRFGDCMYQWKPILTLVEVFGLGILLFISDDLITRYRRLSGQKRAEQSNKSRFGKFKWALELLTEESELFRSYCAGDETIKMAESFLDQEVLCWEAMPETG